MKKIFLLAILFSLSATSYSCAQTKLTQKEKLAPTYNNSKTLVVAQQFTFVAKLVYNNKKREKLDISTNTLTVNDSNISATLKSLSTDNKLISIDGTIEGYKADYNDDEQKISVEFSSGSNTIYIDIKPNGNTFLTVKSSDGSTTSFNGYLVKN